MNYSLNFKDFDSYIRETLKRNYLFLLILILGSFLRLYKLGDKSLWMDELILVYKVINYDNIITALNYRSYTSPMEILSIYYPINLGNNSDFFLRFPYAIFSILSICLVYLLVRELFNKKTALVSAFIFSISPILIWYAQEGRIYSLFIFMSLLSAIFFIKTIKKTSTKNLLLFTIFTFLLLITHLFATLMVFVEFLYFLTIILSDKIKLPDKINLQNYDISCFKPLNIFFSFLVMGMLYLPYLLNSIAPIFLQSGLNYGNENLIPRIYQTFGTYTVSLGYFPIAEQLGNFNSIFFVIVVLFFIALLLAGIYYTFRQNAYESFFLFLWLFAPMSICVIVNLLTGKSIFVERYLLFCITPYLIFISGGILCLNDKIISFISNKKPIKKRDLFCRYYYIVIVVLILISLFYIPMIFYGYQIEKQDWKGTAEFLNNFSESEDKIIFIGMGNDDYFRNYYSGSSDIFYLPQNVEEIKFEIMNNSENYRKTWLVVSPHNGVTCDFKDFFDNYTLEKEAYDRRYIPNTGNYILRGAVFSIS